MKHKPLHNIVGDIYALQQEEDFHRKLLVYLADEIEANSASFRLDCPTEDELSGGVVHNFDAKENQKYIQGLYRYDSYRVWLMGQSSEAFHGTHETPEIEKAYVRTMYYEDSAHIVGIRYAMGGFFADLDGVSTRFGFHRPADHSSFGEAPVNFLNTLLPHIKQALHLHRSHSRLMRSQEGMRSIKASETAIFLLSKTDAVISHNEAAEKLLEKKGVKKQHKSLRFSCIKTDKAFRTLSEQARHSVILMMRRTDSGVAQIKITLNECDYTLRVEPWQYNSLLGTPEVGVLLSLKPAPNSFVSAQDIADELKLTLAEAEVAKYIFDGLAGQSIAEKRNVSDATIRSQLKSIYSKLGISRATELSRLIATRVMV